MDKLTQVRQNDAGSCDIAIIKDAYALRLGGMDIDIRMGFK